MHEAEVADLYFYISSPVYAVLRRLGSRGASFRSEPVALGPWAKVTERSAGDYQAKATTDSVTL